MMEFDPAELELLRQALIKKLFALDHIGVPDTNETKKAYQKLYARFQNIQHVPLPTSIVGQTAYVKTVVGTREVSIIDDDFPRMRVLVEFVNWTVGPVELPYDKLYTDPELTTLWRK